MDLGYKISTQIIRLQRIKNDGTIPSPSPLFYAILTILLIMTDNSKQSTTR